MTISDINAEARALCDADTTSYPAADLLRRVNTAYEQVVGWLLTADGTWQWDDSNYTDLPVGTINLVASQSGYTFNDKLLEIEKVSVKNVDGDWVVLLPIDEVELSEDELAELYETAGMPVYYDKVSDDTIKLLPAPIATYATLTAGLKVHFRRTASLFTSAEVTTGTKVPGFASLYHVILAYMAAIPYCMSYKKDRVALYEKKVLDLKNNLIQLYSQREKDKRKVMTFKRRHYK